METPAALRATSWRRCYSCYRSTAQPSKCCSLPRASSHTHRYSSKPHRHVWRPDALRLPAVKDINPAGWQSAVFCSLFDTIMVAASAAAARATNHDIHLHAVSLISCEVHDMMSAVPQPPWCTAMLCMHAPLRGVAEVWHARRPGVSHA